jgi:general secretion pathway protein I
MRSNHLINRRRGFTLVEVLASVAILAIVVPFVMNGASLATSTASVARHQAEASTLGEAKLADMVVEDTWETEGTTGTFAPAYPQYRWTLQTQQRSEADVMELMLTVTWQERGRDQSLNLSTMVYSAANAAAASGTGTGGTP